MRGTGKVMNAKQILEREFLEIRAKILQIAASLDRINRADGSVDDDPNMELLRKGISILQSDSSEHAADVQMLFSVEYDQQWQSEYQIAGDR